jgi:hypothetical protein
MNKSGLPSLFPVICSWAISVLLLLYIVCRAWNVAMTWDECWSYTHYALDTAWNIVSYHSNTSNNHTWNSLCMRLEVFTLPFCEISLRLHSVLAFVAFMYFGWLLLKDIANPYWGIAAFLLLNLNPFMLDFFALARGYAVSLAAMMASLYFLRQYMLQQGKRWLFLVLSLLCAEVAAAGIFSLATYFVALIGFVVIWSSYEQFIRKKKSLLKTVLSIAIVAAPFLYWFVVITTRLQSANEFYYGGVDGFWKDTVGSLITASLYVDTYPGWVGFLVGIAVVFICLAGLAILIYRLRKAGFDLYSYSGPLAIISILAFCVIGTMLQHVLLGTRYLFDRTALYLLVLFMLGTGYAFYYLYQYSKYTLIISGVITASVIMHFLHVMNISYTQYWRKEADIKEMMADLDKLHMDPHNNAQHFVGAYWTLAPAAEFYRQYRHYYWMNEVTGDVYYKEKFLINTKEGEKYFRGHQLRLLKNYPLSGASLYENLSYQDPEAVFEKHISMEPSEPECKNAHLVTTLAKDGSHAAMLRSDPQEFSPGIDVAAGTFIRSGDSSLAVKATVWVYMDKPCIQGQLIVSVADSSGKITEWETHDIIHYFNKAEWVPIEFTVWNLNVPSVYAHIRVNVWNTSTADMYVDAMNVKVLRYAAKP